MPRLFRFWVQVPQEFSDRAPAFKVRRTLSLPSSMLFQLSRKHYIAYGLICFIWGSTWGAIRLLVRAVPPFRAAAIRFFLAAIVLLGIALARGNKLSLTARQC